MRDDESIGSQFQSHPERRLCAPGRAADPHRKLR